MTPEPDRFVQAVWLTIFLLVAVATGLIAACLGISSIGPWWW